MSELVSVQESVPKINKTKFAKNWKKYGKVYQNFSSKMNLTANIKFYFDASNTF